jgi:RNA polymerase sigma factor (sigma-70 family)
MPYPAPMMRHEPLQQPEEAIRRVYAYVAYRLGPGADAEDVTSETIERALRYRKTYDHRRGSPAAWLIGISTRVIADHQRARGVEVSGDELHEQSEDVDPADRSDARMDIQSGMLRLDERSRELLALRFGADLKAKQIAELVEMETNAVEVALHRALGRLRKILEASEDPESVEAPPQQAARGSTARES